MNYFPYIPYNMLSCYQNRYVLHSVAHNTEQSKLSQLRKDWTNFCNSDVLTITKIISMPSANVVHESMWMHIKDQIILVYEHQGLPIFLSEENWENISIHNGHHLLLCTHARTHTHTLTNFTHLKHYFLWLRGHKHIIQAFFTFLTISQM
jgi:hypothetical protein